MTEVPQGKGPGTYQRILIDAYGDAPYWSAVIWCPSCAKPLSLVKHQIAANGQVAPSVGHPESYPPCGWHETPRLLDWDGTAPPPQRIIETCARCSFQGRQLGGWGTWSGGPGLICPACVEAHTADLRNASTVERGK